jgi:hypothetical protein
MAIQRRALGFEVEKGGKWSCRIVREDRGGYALLK